MGTEVMQGIGQFSPARHDECHAGVGAAQIIFGVAVLPQKMLSLFAHLC